MWWADNERTMEPNDLFIVYSQRFQIWTLRDCATSYECIIIDDTFIFL